AFKELGRPNLFWGVTAGNMDSMVNRYTSDRKIRSDDAYSPDGKAGLRPDRSVLVYAQRCREAFDDVPVVVGGIEASLRRIAHYDYWSDKVRRSILLDSKADLLVFGMGERPIWEIADRLNRGEKVGQLRDVRGTAYLINNEETKKHEADPAVKASDRKTVVLPSFEEVSTNLEKFALMTRAFQMETNPGNARAIVQRHGDRGVFFNPPATPLGDGKGDESQGLSNVAMDELYDLPFNRAPHPMYRGEGIPAFETVKHSVVLMRGCFGGCTFCSITEHEGRVIQNRSKDSVLKELRELRRMGDFRGTVTDLGGPTANMYALKCKSQEIESKCRKLSCVHPGVCENLNTDHGPLIDLMREARKEEGIKHIFIASGVRYDLAELSPEYVKELATFHTGGQLSVAPEHVSPRVLEKMKKPGIESYERFQSMFACESKNAGKEQYDIPYFISGHPGSTLDDMIDLAMWLKQSGRRPRQVQDFIPTPMSVAACMFFSGIDPLKMEPVFVAKGLKEKRLQKALILYWNPEHWDDVREALTDAGRTDLTGRGPNALVRPQTAAERSRSMQRQPRRS
ncbi:MAG: YgiQ family radical SAM protein, partial [Archangium sp.]